MSQDYSLSELSFLIHDMADDRTDIDAMVASGDCFVTLASMLDGAHDEPSKQAAIEQSVRALLYLQRHYRIVIKERPDYRQ